MTKLKDDSAKMACDRIVEILSDVSVFENHMNIFIPRYNRKDMNQAVAMFFESKKHCIPGCKKGQCHFLILPDWMKGFKKSENLCTFLSCNELFNEPLPE